jgi:two-component system, OmpR family, phosphate regulon response regulator PhoB
VTGQEGACGLDLRTDERGGSPIADSGHLLLILTSRDVQSVADLAAASGQSPAITVRSLGRLVDQGFLVVGDQSGTAVYRLKPKAEQAIVSDLPEHILLIEDDVMIGELVVTVLEDEGYAVVVCLTPLDAMALLHRVSFDLVITDGFSREPGAVFVNTSDLLRSAGATPVALFSAHKLDLELAKAAGFRDVISKPFDLDILVRQVKVLLGDPLWSGPPDPPQEGELWSLATGRAYADPAMASQGRSFQAAGG